MTHVAMEYLFIRGTPNCLKMPNGVRESWRDDENHTDMRLIPFQDFIDGG